MTSPAPVSTPTGLTLAEATIQLEGLLSAPAKRSVPEPSQDDVETKDAPDDLSIDPDEDIEMEPTEPTEPNDDEDDPAPEPEPAPRAFRVKVDGQEVEVSEQELLNGYSRTSDYTRKTQAVAEEKRRIDAENAALQQEREKYATNLAKLEAALSQQLPDVDWDKLRQENPEEFATQYATYQLQQQRIAAVQQERMATAQKALETHRARLVEHVASERQKLHTAIPELASDKGTALYGELKQFAKSIGFSDDDISNVTDHRAIVLLHKAMLGDRLQTAKAEAVKKISTSPTLKPGAGVKKPAVSDLTRAKQRLAKTHSVKDAAAALELLL